MVLIIGIHGKMGTGKDYITQNVIFKILDSLKLKYIQLSFADQLKVNCMTKYNIPFDELYVQKTKESRQLLQIEGTEVARYELGKDIWIRYFHNWIQVLSTRGIDIIVTPDVRFLNEYKYILSQNGLIIKISAPTRNHQRLLQESKGDTHIYNTLKNHISECDLDIVSNNQFHLVINNELKNNTSYVNELTELILNKSKLH